MYITKNQNLKILKSNLLDTIENIGYAFTTRIGGISPAPYNELNIHSILANEKENSFRNREILGNTIGFDSKKLVLAQQVHGENIHIVTKNDVSKGAFSHLDAIPETDALITDVKNIPIMLLYADCLPILLADKSGKAIGVVHAGWKGTAKKIVMKTIEKMCTIFDLDSSNIVTAIGIGISKNFFEIQSDTKEKLELATYSTKSFEIRNEKIFADLLEINKSQIINAGVNTHNIDYNTELCSYKDSDLFYSYRRDNQVTGRHSAVIWLK